MDNISLKDKLLRGKGLGSLASGRSTVGSAVACAVQTILLALTTPIVFIGLLSSDKFLLVAALPRRAQAQTSAEVAATRLRSACSFVTGSYTPGSLQSRHFAAWILTGGAPLQRCIRAACRKGRFSTAEVSEPLPQALKRIHNRGPGMHA